jgi:2-keto-3-deoxy-L-rhamnonate aldolase RhmA
MPSTRSQMLPQSSYVNNQMLPGTNHARAIARSGVDWVCVDTEHGNIAGMNFVRLVSEEVLLSPRRCDA